MMKVFVSHSGASADHARKIEAILTADGVQPVETDVPVQSGVDWAARTKEQVAVADAMVFIVEPGVERDARVQAEWRAAINESWAAPSKPMLPVLVRDAQLPGFLSGRQAFRVQTEDDWIPVAKTLVETLRNVEVWPQKAAAGGHHHSDALKARLLEIAQLATKLGPSDDELRRQVEALRGRIQEERGQRAESLELAEMHVQLADRLKQLGQERDALPELSAAAEILERDPSPAARRRLTRIRVNLATLCWRLDDTQRARDELVRARDLYMQLEGPEALSSLLTRFSLSTLPEELGETEAARRERDAAAADALKKAADITEKTIATRVLPRLGRLLTDFFSGRDKTK